MMIDKGKMERERERERERRIYMLRLQVESSRRLELLQAFDCKAEESGAAGLDERELTATMSLLVPFFRKMKL